MEEIQPGVLHWTAYRDTIGQDVHSYLHVPSGTLLDPMVPLQGVDAVPRVERIVLTNRLHYRHSDRIREAFGCPVLCNEAGLHHFPGRDVKGFSWGDELAPGVTAHEVGVLCPEETAVQLGTALAFADAVIRGRHGELGFVPDYLLGDDPDAVKAGLRERFRRLADELEFDALLMAHGEPISIGGRSALRTFAHAPTAGGPPG